MEEESKDEKRFDGEQAAEKSNQSSRMTVLPSQQQDFAEAAVERRGERTVTEHTAIFSMDGSDGVGSEEEDEEQEEYDLMDESMRKMGSERFGAQRLSFMFEHNNFMNMRIQALVSDLRNNNLLQGFQDELDEEPSTPSSASRGPRRSRVQSKVSLKIPEAVDDEEEETWQPKLSRNSSQGSVGGDPDAKSFPKKVSGAHKSRPRKNSILPDDHEHVMKIRELQQRNAELEELLKQSSAGSSDMRADEVAFSSSPSIDRVVAKGAEAADKYANEREKEESNRMRKQLVELRAELDTERKRACQADKDNAGLRRDLKKCQHVIERLVKELEMATRTVSAPPIPPVSRPTPSAKQDANAPVKRNTTTDVSASSAAAGKRNTAVEQNAKMPPSAGDLEKMIRRDMERQETPAQPGFMSDLSSAIGSFFGSLGTAKQNNAAPVDDLEDFEEPFCWAEEPHGRNVAIDEDGQTASFNGKDKTALHAYVVTEEPPLLEADQGYGFEVLIKKVRTGQEDGLAIGFTATPPDMWPEELPETADLIEQSWLVGYGGEMYDGGSEQWHPCSWSPTNLKEGDRVGVQVSQDGKFFVVVNQKVVYSTNIPIVADGPPLFGVVDLLGNTDAVTLLD